MKGDRFTLGCLRENHRQEIIASKTEVSGEAFDYFPQIRAQTRFFCPACLNLALGNQRIAAIGYKFPFH